MRLGQIVKVYKHNMHLTAFGQTIVVNTGTRSGCPAVSPLHIGIITVLTQRFPLLLVPQGCHGSKNSRIN